MEHAYSILMFCFAGMLCIYGFIMYRTRDIGLVPKAGAAKIRDKAEYAKQIGKIVIITALAPFTSGLIAWDGQRVWYAMALLVAGFVICIREGVKIMQEAERKSDEPGTEQEEQ